MSGNYAHQKELWLGIGCFIDSTVTGSQSSKTDTGFLTLLTTVTGTLDVFNIA